VHKLLERQLRKHIGSGPLDAAHFEALLFAIDAAYTAQDTDRALLERSIELASGELQERNARLESDIEAIKRLELELRQADKLKAVGQLASGIAHEINTPIQYVGDSVTFMKEAFGGLLHLAKALRERSAECADPSATLAELVQIADDIEVEYLLAEVPLALEQTSDGVRRVAGIVSAMKDFGRKDGREKTLVDVSRCIQSTLIVAQNELKYVADVDVMLGELPPIFGYPGELNQVILNLLVNASHAVAQRFAGTAERGLIRVRSETRAGFVVISVADNGCGIPLEHQPRIFEPFFTTKAVGSGTGQGLAITRSIVVEKHGGTLSFESRPGEGTTFCVSLPTEVVETAKVARLGGERSSVFE